jgi:hypothetical protein
MFNCNASQYFPNINPHFFDIFGTLATLVENKFCQYSVVKMIVYNVPAKGGGLVMAEATSSQRSCCQICRVGAG